MAKRQDQPLFAYSVMYPPKSSHYINNIPGVFCIEVDKQASAEDHEQARIDIEAVVEILNRHQINLGGA